MNKIYYLRKSSKSNPWTLILKGKTDCDGNVVYFIIKREEGYRMRIKLNVSIIFEFNGTKN